MAQHNEFMKLCFELAKESVLNGNEPFGAVLVKKGKVMLTSENKIFTHSDPTHHAELALIREYCQAHETMDLSEYTLYTSCEPCFMCSGAMVWTNLGTLVFSAGSDDLNKMLNQVPFSSSDTVFKYSHTGPKVIKHVLHEEGVDILKDYFG